MMDRQRFQDTFNTTQRRLERNRSYDRFPRLLLACAALLFLLVACRPDAPTYHLQQFSQNGATVTFRLERKSSGKYVLAAEFTPDEPGYYLYAKDLPDEGVDGTGRPTKFAIAGGALTAVGEAVEDVTPQEKQYPGRSAPHLIYPPGPVTLRIPVELPANVPDDLMVEVTISFMVCHIDGACKMPVIDEQIVFDLPASLWQGRQ